MKNCDIGAQAPQPTLKEVADLAVTLARGEYELGGPMVELFHWPAWATPCRDQRRMFLITVEKFKQKAAEMLRQHYEYYHVLAVRRERWLRVHPSPRTWAWTRTPLRHALPPPRRRSFIPPILVCPDAVSPPLTPLPETSPKRPGRREREVLLCFSRLFDNRRVVWGDLRPTFFPGWERGPRTAREAVWKSPVAFTADTPIMLRNAVFRVCPTEPKMRIVVPDEEKTCREPVLTKYGTTRRIFVTLS